MQPDDTTNPGGTGGGMPTDPNAGVPAVDPNAPTPTAPTEPAGEAPMTPPAEAPVTPEQGGGDTNPGGAPTGAV